MESLAEKKQKQKQKTFYWMNEFSGLNYVLYDLMHSDERNLY
jgi:hypothetical protein